MVAMKTSSRVGSDILHQWLPNDLQKKSLNLLAFAAILKSIHIKVNTVAAGRIPAGQNRAKTNKNTINKNLLNASLLFSPYWNNK